MRATGQYRERRSPKGRAEAERTDGAARSAGSSSEVHHKIVNHLQGIVGLIRMRARFQREESDVVGAAVAQILAIAATHGVLAMRGGTCIEVATLIVRLIDALRPVMPVPVRFECDPTRHGGSHVSAAEGVHLAVIVSEMLWSGGICAARFRSGYLEAQLRRSAGAPQLRVACELPQSQVDAGAHELRSCVEWIRSLLPETRGCLHIGEECGRIAMQLQIGPSAGLGRSRGIRASGGSVPARRHSKV